MNDKTVICPSRLGGIIEAIPSKSHVHRLLICAALGDRDVKIPCPTVSEDIEATARCLASLGAAVTYGYGGGAISISPIFCSADKKTAPPALLDCGESGSTYRFLVPLAPALGRAAEFHLAGRLPQRPMDELWTALEAGGAHINGRGTSVVNITGQLASGRYVLPGDVSSQFISGLLFALPLLECDSEIVIRGTLQSAGYVRMTLETLREFSIDISETTAGFAVAGGQKYIAPSKTVFPEGDWSNSALWLCAAAAGGSGVTVRGLRPGSSQGDSGICNILRRFGADVDESRDGVTVRPGRPLCGISFDASDIPDLVPALSLVAAAAEGITTVTGAGRLTLKESDRRDTVCRTINALGGQAGFSGDTIIIKGTGNLAGGCVDAYGDHRIAMLAAAASVICRGEIILSGADAVRKSYPDFFGDFRALGGVTV